MTRLVSSAVVHRKGLATGFPCRPSPLPRFRPPSPDPEVGMPWDTLGAAPSRHAPEIAAILVGVHAWSGLYRRRLLCRNSIADRVWARLGRVSIFRPMASDFGNVLPRLQGRARPNLVRAWPRNRPMLVATSGRCWPTSRTDMGRPILIAPQGGGTR